jgi:hypothetical protein
MINKPLKLLNYENISKKKWLLACSYKSFFTISRCFFDDFAPLDCGLDDQKSCFNGAIAVSKLKKKRIKIEIELAAPV